MGEAHRSMSEARVIRLNDHIARLYRIAAERGALEATTGTMASLIPGDLHLAFLTGGQGDVSFSTSHGAQGAEFIMATLAVADSHPLIYQRDKEVNAISDVLESRQWRSREMYRLARPFMKMEDALGTDMRLAPGQTFSTCVIRDRRNFGEGERAELGLILPHFSNILGMHGESNARGERFHMLALSTLPRTRKGLEGLLRDLLNLCPEVSTRLVDWIRHCQATGQIGTGSLTCESPQSACTAVFIPGGGKSDGAVIIRPRERKEGRPVWQPGLTRRENEIGQWMCAGKTNAEIAIILGIRAGTVKRHLENIYAKLGVPNRVCAARMLRDAAGPRY